jgi:hypothetical protein
MRPKILKTLLLFLSGQHFFVQYVLVISISYHKIYLRPLVSYQMCWLFVEELLDLAVLNLVEDPLQQLFELILAHNGLRHGDKSYFCLLPHLLVGVLQVSR